MNIAARIQPLARPEGICISEDLKRQIENHEEIDTEELGKAELKNIDVQMRVWRVVMAWEERRSKVSDRVKFAWQRKKVRRAVFGILAVLVVTLFAWMGWSMREGKKEEEIVNVGKHRIAVMPFVNMSGDEKEEYFADGMTEEMISQLSKISGLEVIARTSVMKYKNKEKDIAEIGQELKVGTILEGSVRKEANQVRITVQLIDVQSQAHLWSENYDRELKGIFAIQSDIAKRVAEASQVTLLAEEKQRIEKKGTENLEAYDFYLKGLYHWNKVNKEGFEKAIAYFEQAIEKDPTYAQAYTELASSYSMLMWLAFLPPKETLPKAKVAAEKALEMDDMLSEAHASLG
ncbi:MAG: hypothetical protein L0Y56_01610, partial [Nitrospira sp.]|nr:hypothetical protein [Nitrospira sp.]